MSASAPLCGDNGAALFQRRCCWSRSRLQHGCRAQRPRSKMPCGFRFSPRSPTGRVAICTSWKWTRRALPRSIVGLGHGGHYAKVVDRLNAAGARSITFDVDLSSPSEGTDDGRLAQALANSAAVVTLPTFAQVAGPSDARMLDTLPIPILRDHAVIASVAVSPDSDGLVRQMPFGSITDGTPRPSLAAQIAGRGGTAGTRFSRRFRYRTRHDTAPQFRRHRGWPLRSLGNRRQGHIDRRDGD